MCGADAASSSVDEGGDATPSVDERLSRLLELARLDTTSAPEQPAAELWTGGRVSVDSPAGEKLDFFVDVFGAAREACAPR